MRYAVIDIGTNSIKLLIAEMEGTAVSPIWEETEQTRLGQGFYQERRLQPGAIEQTARTVARFVANAKAHEVASTWVLATSAVRDAINRDALLEAVHTASGLPVEIISGDQEADWVFDGVQSDPTLAGRSLLIMDLGGGSTEFILGQGEAHLFRKSFALGTVRLLEQIQPADPPKSDDWVKCRAWLEQFLRKEVEPLLGPILRARHGQRPLLVGTGGTTSILAAIDLGLTAFDRTRIEQIVLTQKRVWEFQRLLWRKPLSLRREIKGLPPNRADVILFGVAVFGLVMEVFGFEELKVSTRGLRFGAIMNIAQRSAESRT